MQTVGLRMSALAAVLLLLGAGCGDDGVETSIGPPTSTTLATPSSTVAAAPATTVPPSTAAAVTTTTLPATTTTFVSVEGTVTGVVIEVEGTLAGIDSFVLRLENGSDLTLVPAPGVLFDDVAPIGHIRDHLVSGVPVVATYVTEPDGPPVVTAIGDAGGGEHSHDE